MSKRLLSSTLAMALLLVAACEQTRSSLDGDTVSIGTPPINPGTDTAEIVASGWESDAGDYVILPTIDGGVNAGSLLRPGVSGERLGDTTGLGALIAPGRIELFSRAGKIGEATIDAEQSRRVDPECAAWPTARLAFANGARPAPWTAAFEAGRIEAIPLDSIEGLPTRDSARLAADLTRLASGLRDDTTGTFRGLPFVVLRAYRARGADAPFIVATLIRRIPQEDSPREERLVMVIDAPGTDPKGWRVAWFERASGTEDELLVAEPLLAYRARGATDARILFGRDDGVSLSAAVLSRTASGWSLQWESPASGCEY